MVPQYRQLDVRLIYRNEYRSIGIFLLVACLSGCTSTKPLYYWGEYENLLYSRFINPGEADPATQSIKIRQDIQIAQDNGQRVPPGIYAHLGYMLYLQGQYDAALQALETEKALYPESTVFVDRMLKNMKP